MTPLVFDKVAAGIKPIYNVGDPVDCMYIVR